jgi:hypothetical protein
MRIAEGYDFGGKDTSGATIEVSVSPSGTIEFNT